MVALRIAAPPARVFEAFTAEIGQWWRPNPLFQLTEHRAGRLAIEPRLDGRVTETYADGDEFEVGRVRAWEPPERVVLSWRAASFQQRLAEWWRSLLASLARRATIHHPIK